MRKFANHKQDIEKKVLFGGYDPEATDPREMTGIIFSNYKMEEQVRVKAVEPDGNSGIFMTIQAGKREGTINLNSRNLLKDV